MIKIWNTLYIIHRMTRIALLMRDVWVTLVYRNVSPKMIVIEMIHNVCLVHVPEHALVLVKHAELLAGFVRKVCV